MTVLVGGLRVLGANAGGSRHGVLTKTPGRLTNDFFVNLLDMSTVGSRRGGRATEAATARPTRLKWTGTRVDLIFGSTRSSARLRRSMPARTRRRVVRDFVAAWTKVMNLDRFDLA